MGKAGYPEMAAQGRRRAIANTVAPKDEDKLKEKRKARLELE